MEKKKKDVSTGSLLSRLFRTSSFEKYRERNAEAMKLPAFHEHITERCRERGAVREHVIRAAGLDRVYGHQIFTGRCVPSRDKVIQLAFALGADVAEAQYMLKLARKPELYPRVERDAVVLYCLNRRLGLMETQELLCDRGLTTLGGDRNDA